MMISKVLTLTAAGWVEGVHLPTLGLGADCKFQVWNLADGGMLLILFPTVGVYHEEVLWRLVHQEKVQKPEDCIGGGVVSFKRRAALWGSTSLVDTIGHDRPQGTDGVIAEAVIKKLQEAGLIA